MSLRSTWHRFTGKVAILTGAVCMALALLTGCETEDTRTPAEKERARAVAQADAAERRYWRCMEIHRQVYERHRLSPQAAHDHCRTRQ